LVGIEPEPSLIPVMLDSEGIPLLMPTTLQESRFGKAAGIKKVFDRENELYLAQGVEYSKGGIANLLDIMVGGFVYGYFGPMDRLLDPSMSALKHGPYWVILDEKGASQSPLFRKKFVTCS